MKRKRIQYNELNEEIYSTPHWSKSKIAIFIYVILTFSFILNFSLEDRLNRSLNLLLSQNQNCPMNFEKAEIHYFMPKVLLKKLNVKGLCFGNPENDLILQNISVGLAFPSFYPLGIKLHVEINEGQTHLDIYPILSIFSRLIKFDESTLDAKLLSVFSATKASYFAGIIKINGLLKFDSEGLIDGELLLDSKNLSIPAQNINGFEVPYLKLNRFELKSEVTKANYLKVNTLKIGDNKSPAMLSLSGQVNVSPNSFSSSLVVLKGNMKLSSLLLSKFQFLNLFLPKDRTDGNYVFSLTGPLSQLTPKVE